MKRKRTPTSWQPTDMKRSENRKADIDTVGRIPSAFWLTIVFIALCLIGAFTSCTKKVYVPVETIKENVIHRTDTLRQVTTRYDSIYVRDSIALVQRNDTVFLTKYKDQVKYLYRTDTVHNARVDSIYSYIEKPVPYEVEKITYVEKPLKWWQKTLMWMGVAAVVLLGLIIYLFIRKRTP